jgi:hypothetical protein
MSQYEPPAFKKSRPISNLGKKKAVGPEALGLPRHLPPGELSQLPGDKEAESLVLLGGRSEGGGLSQILSVLTRCVPDAVQRALLKMLKSFNTVRRGALLIRDRQGATIFWPIFAAAVLVWIRAPAKGATASCLPDSIPDHCFDPRSRERERLVM